jgi:hypothetical protein
MKNLILFCLLVGIISSCKSEQVNDPKSKEQSTADVWNFGNNQTVNAEGKSDRISAKTYNGVKYTVDLINAVDFVSRKGEKLELSERLELSKESVAILKIDLQSMKETSVFESSKITMDKEDAMKYLVGQISNDFSIEQNGESISPAGVEYDAGISEPDNIKVFLFFNRIDLNKPSSALYYDRLFGAGLMRFKITKGK